MSFLTDTAAGGAGSGAGFTGVDPATGAGYSGSAAAGGAGPTEVGGQQSLIHQLAGYLKDPEVQKTLGDLLKSYGTMSEHASQLPPQAAQIVQQAIRSGGKMKPPTDPYLGDAGQYMTPELAQDTMRKMGIPFGG